MIRIAYPRSGQFVLLVVSLFYMGFAGLTFADSNFGPESQEGKRAESRAEKRALIVTDQYIIGPEDILEVSVWRTPELSREIVVRPDGRISLPLIGEVMAVGSTTVELRDDITEKLKVYKENPTVAIIVKAIKSYFFTVQGAIGGGGSAEGQSGGGGGKIPLLSHTTLVQAIGLAGGLSSDAVRSRITIFRLGINGEAPKKIVVNYEDIILRDGENIEIKPGDTIVVPSQTQIFLP
ncbi:polysaccharide biosynthesis/export family protein [Candidatus Nitrospira neomarina]|uniref:Polysaccharide biosynthesis/export family protein n=1 Tax=Candidatus Nitrospira neomarina TaxID=3020899 RepID=A0AA96K539_9BACT|nr:polysaccharide biosynthesis/export family protein [Candidatus Nitrospira neomarina]WNM64034.1 polysaccharide biosynthesis/export family protein [Candidatus Nitrospira neomarina]